MTTDAHITKEMNRLYSEVCDLKRQITFLKVFGGFKTAVIAAMAVYIWKLTQ